ncbi:hypothetical protein D9602_03090 [Sphingomonas sp. TX0522]|nr:hypothetical protein [Sphingomonas sp. TX0522]
MMHQRIEGQAGAEVVAAERWCILRTSTSRTLPLAEALLAIGIDAWSPRRTVKRPAPGRARRYVMGQRRIMVEVTVPILPGIVFVDARRLHDAISVSLIPFGPLPEFSIMQVAGRAPEIGAAAIRGLLDAEAEATVGIIAEREADSRDAERRERAERMRRERERRKALRRERKAFNPGAEVEVTDMPALAGMTGVIVESKGATAKVHFGGPLTITVEAWQIIPTEVQSTNTFDRAAA